MELFFKIMLSFLLVIGLAWQVLKCIGYHWASNEASGNRNFLETLYYKRMFYRSIVITSFYSISTILVNTVIWAVL